MAANFIAQRSSRHRWVAPEEIAGPLRKARREFFYERLMQVAIRHDYYNISRCECPDFTCLPTLTSAALMRDLGLLFRAEATGFSVLYDKNREAELLNYLARQKKSDLPEQQSWTRLTFTLTLTNPYFVSFTGIPIDTNPSERNLYFTNHKAKGTDADAALGAGENLPVIPTQVAVTADVREVRVLDIGDRIVLCKPRCVTEQAAKTKNPADFTCADLGHSTCMTKIYLDFGGLPEDRYVIQRIGCKGPVLPPFFPSDPGIYTQSYPIPFCLIDLLFAAPTTVPGGIYPVRKLSSKPSIHPVRYVLRFERRSIQWRYYLVPQPPTVLTDLEIVQEDGEPEIGFCGPCSVELANGALAYRFVSEGEIPLEEQSDYSFRLLGRHALNGHVRTLVDRLPVASGQRVQPGKRPTATPYSDIFVYV
jgi:hypothetical protein